MKLAEPGAEPGPGEQKKPGELLMETPDMLRACVHIFFAVYTIDVEQEFTLTGKNAEAANKKHQHDIN